MTREEKLYSMRMVELAEVAEKLGIKIDKKGSKSKAIEKILAAEEMNKQNEKELAKEAKDSLEISNAIAADFEESLAGDGTPLAEVGKEIAEQAKKKAKDAKSAKQKVKKEKKAKVDDSAKNEGKKALVEMLDKNNKLYKIVGKRLRLVDADGKCYAYMLFNKTWIKLYIMESCDAFSKIKEEVTDNKYSKSRYNKTFMTGYDNLKSIVNLATKNKEAK